MFMQRENQKNLKSLLIFCLTIVNYQINYNIKHKIDKFGKNYLPKRYRKTTYLIVLYIYYSMNIQKIKMAFL